MYKINILGLGYVGLTLAVALARKGLSVEGIEINQEIINKLDKGEAHFYEPGLENFLKEVIKNGKFTYSKSVKKASEPEIYVITVGTPLDKNKNASMKSITSVTNEIVENCVDNSLIITRSTTKIGTTRNTLVPLFEKKEKNVHFAVCPERTVEGTALNELLEIPQIIGSPDPIAQRMSQELFSNLAPSTPILNTWEGAETVKLMDNTYRDIQFAIANEFAQLIEEIGEEAHRVISIANSGYKRTNIAKPGLVGGPCLEKDPIILEQSAESFGVKMPITSAARSVNYNSVSHGFLKIRQYFEKNKLTVSKAIILGLAFKGNPSTSDTRGSLAINLIDNIRQCYPDAEILGYDMHVQDGDMRDLNCILTNNIYEDSKNSDLIIIQHDADYIRNLDLQILASSMKPRGLIYDFWSIQTKSLLNLENEINYYAYGSFSDE